MARRVSPEQCDDSTGAAVMLRILSEALERRGNAVPKLKRWRYDGGLQTAYDAGERTGVAAKLRVQMS